MAHYNKEQFYFLRQGEYYDSGAGNYGSMPKLYTLKGARREAKYRNGISWKVTNGLWEVVPVTFTLGVPIEL